jgi:hypothetical protein
VILSVIITYKPENTDEKTWKNLSQIQNKIIRSFAKNLATIQNSSKMAIKRTNSESLFSKAKNYFPGGVNSPVRALNLLMVHHYSSRKVMDA